MKKSFVPISKQSKKAQKAYHSTQRSTWGILNPATRTMPNGKAYNRKKDSLPLPFFFAVSSIAVSPFP